MAHRNEVAQAILEDTFRGNPNISARPMFGAHALYFQGKIFAILEDGEIFLKVSPDTLPDFEKRDSRPFSYPKKDGSIQYMRGYWLAPQDILEDYDLLMEWVCRSAGISS